VPLELLEQQVARISIMKDKGDGYTFVAVHGLLSRAAQSRLKLERKIFANLYYPNIARLFDGHPIRRR
jgi:hypothetical protein